MAYLIKITPSIVIDDQEIEEIFVRSSGPGGQNVNKVSTAVHLRFNVDLSPALPEDVKMRLRKTAGRRMTAEGVLVIRTERFRTQEKNRQEARKRLIALIQKAAQPPKKRKKTRPTAAAGTQRLEKKRHHSRIKRLRKTRDEDWY